MAKRDLDTMTVGTLRQLLKRYPENTPIVFAHPSHDYWRTELAGEISDLEEGVVEWSGYHEGWKTLDPDKADDVNEVIAALVLR